MSPHVERARLLMAQHRYELAEEQLRLALLEDERRGEAHALLALCLLERERFDDAQEQAQLAIHEEPDESYGFYVLARVLMDRRQLDEAERIIREAIRIDPTCPDYFGELAHIKQQQYQWKECLAAAEEGLAWDSNHEVCVNMRAIALVKLGRRDEAGQSIEAALQHNPDDPLSHANQGWTLLHQGQPLKAVEHFREALRLEPNFEWARQGIVEAMKARNFLYRWVLSFFLWMNRFPPKVQLALLFGLMFGQQILVRVMAAVPALKPFSPFVIGGYILFVWMSWTSSTLFNLVLCLNRFGRLVLNPSEKLDASLAGACVGSALLVGIVGTLGNVPASMGWMVGGLFLGLMLPVTQCFRETGNKQKFVAAYSVGLLVVIGITLWRLVQLELWVWQVGPEFALNQANAAQTDRMFDAFLTWWRYGLNGVVLSTWLGMGLAVLPESRR